MSYAVFPLSIPGAANFWQQLEYRMWPEQSRAEIRWLLTPEVSVSAQANVAPHFTHRASIRSFPRGLDEVDCVVLRLASPTARIAGDNPAVVGTLAHHLQMPPAEYLDTVLDLLVSGDYGPKYNVSPWLVLCRDAPMQSEFRNSLLVQLAVLAQLWGVTTFPADERGPLD